MSEYDDSKLLRWYEHTQLATIIKSQMTSIIAGGEQS